MVDATAPATGSEARPPLATGSLRARHLRVFSSPAGARRFRRATDVLLLAPSLLGLGLLVVAYPPSAFEQSLTAFLASFPTWLDPVWTLLYGSLALWALALLVAPLAGRRYRLAFQALASLALTMLVAIVCTRLAVGHWPSVAASLEGRGGSPRFPASRIAEAAAVIVTVTPHLVRPLRTTGRWLLGLGVVAALVGENALPTGVLAALLLAVAAATTVRLALGTSAGRPGLDVITRALGQLGLSVDQLEPAERQVAGVFIIRGKDDAGRTLLIKVVGRDAYDNQLLSKLWRVLWYRNDGSALGLSRVQSVEHEALVTVLAARAGVATADVLTAGTTVEGDALLVLRGDARSFLELTPDDLSDDRLRQLWRSLDLLAGANIAHSQIDPSTLALIGSEPGLIDFGAATVAPSGAQVLADRAQLLSATACLVGIDRALAGALESIGTGGVIALVPYLQPAAFSDILRRELKTAGLDVDKLRAQTARAVDVEEPVLVKLRRVTWGSVIQVALLAFAASVVISAATTVDYEQLRDTVRGAAWGWIGIAFVIAQLPRIAFAMATLGSIAARLSLGPVYAMQLAIGYLNLALPSNVARIAVTIRFFQRQGVPPAASVTSGAIDSVAGNVVQVVLLGLLLVFSEAEIAFNLNAPDQSGVHWLVWAVIAVVVLSVLVVTLVPRVRHKVTDPVRRWWPDVRHTLVSLGGFNKLGLVFLGNIAAEVLFATALGLFAHAFGYSIPLSELLVINISISLLASFVPVPGGIGVVEWGLTVGLVAAGMTDAAALSTVFFYRLSTFYLPPIWGWFALRWLKQHRYL
jgi:uncharacterized membrane protein YbhN (UPF0104 family)